MKARVVGGWARSSGALLAALPLAALLCDVACDVTPSGGQLPVAAPVVETAAPAEPSTPPPSEPDTSAALVARTSPKPRVVLVTLDGVRWEDVFEGADSESQMPILQRFVRERGVALGGPGCEHDMRASGPNFVSLPGYLEMFTGKPTACTHNGCPPVQTKTIVDDAAADRPEDVAVFASWSTYANAVASDRRSIVVSAGGGARSTTSASRKDKRLRYLLEVGAANSGYPGHGDYRPDEHTARIALHYLETVGPRLLVVGLGDADEHGHRGDIPSYRRAVHRADAFIADLDRALERMGEVEQTAVVVTTDHGRARSLRGHGALYPESQRVFVAAFGAGIARRGVACPTEPLRLAHVAGAMRSLLGLPPAPALEQDIAGSSPLAFELTKASERPEGRSLDVR